MSINRGMDKEDVVHIYSGILLSHKKEIVMLSEISQTKKAKYMEM